MSGMSSMKRARRQYISGAMLAVLLAVLLCLFPKPENDLFFELRTGTDILNSGHLPHRDTYSWVRYSTPWTVPEWLAFVVYAAAFRGGGFFGTWLVLAGLTAATALVAYGWLARRSGRVWAFPLTALLLVGMKESVQERPYAYTYFLLSVSLPLVLRARAGRPKLLLWLLPICVLWTNLHQGVVVLVGLLFMLAAGDALTAIAQWLRARQLSPDLLTAAGRAQEEAARRSIKVQLAGAWRMAATGAACVGAAMVSPYGWHVYENIWVTLRSPSLMANVTEWNPSTTLPLLQWQPFLLAAAVVFGSVLFSRRRNFADTLVVLALFAEALLHARNIALFAVGGLIVAAPHFPSALSQARRALGLRVTVPRWLTAAFAVALVGMTALAAGVALRPALGPKGVSPEGIGEAVVRLNDYPAQACAFMDAERLPTNLRLLNDFEAGGYLLWRRPHQRVFTDGRLDVYVGSAFDDMVTLSRTPGSHAWAALVKKYDFDAVLTSNPRQAAAFAARPDWALVYVDPRRPGHPRFRLLLRRDRTTP